MKVSKAKDGRYFRHVGRLINGKQPKFYLGRAKADAMLRAAHLDKYWDFLRNSFEPEGIVTCWTDVSLPIAKAIAQGKSEVTVDVDEYDEFIASSVSFHQQAAYPMRVSNLDRQAQRNGEQQLHQRAKELEEEARQLRLEGGDDRFHEVADAYCNHLAETKRTESRKAISDWGQTLIRQVETLKRLFGNPQLSSWDSNGLDGLIQQLLSRPISDKTGKPYSTKMLRAIRTALTLCLKWVHRNNNYAWSLPKNYKFPSLDLKPLIKEERSRGPQLTPVYPTEDIRLLWRHANPWQRLLTVLGLNCGLGQMEVATLRRDEVFLHQPHPMGDQLQINSKETDSWIIRLRVKTRVWCHWQLWPETVNALQWHQRQWPEYHLDEWVLNSAKKPLLHEGKRNTAIANSWNRLNTDIQKHHPGFTRRSFNKLRKTAANQVRIQSGATIASLFLSHGKPARQDGCLENYTDPEFRNLFEAIDNLRDVYKDLFECVEVPFPDADE